VACSEDVQASEESIGRADSEEEMKEQALGRIDEAIKSLGFAVTPKDVGFALRQSITKLGKAGKRPEFVTEVAAIEGHYEEVKPMRRANFDSMELFHVAFKVAVEKAKELIVALQATISTAELPETVDGRSMRAVISGTITKTNEPVEIQVGPFTLNFLTTELFRNVLEGKAEMQVAMAQHLSESHGASVDKAEDYLSLYRGLRRNLNSFIPKPPKIAWTDEQKEAAKKTREANKKAKAKGAA